MQWRYLQLSLFRENVTTGRVLRWLAWNGQFFSGLTGARWDSEGRD